jgi:CRISPR-associated protein Csx3
MTKPDNPIMVIYSIGVLSPASPEDKLPPLPDIPRGSVVIIEGRAPIWRYGMAFHVLHGSAAAAIAVYDPKLGAVVVASHNKFFGVGQILDIEIKK